MLIEEIAEAVDAAARHGEGPHLRAELVQTAAVLLAWIECIDRRTPPPQVPETGMVGS